MHTHATAITRVVVVALMNAAVVTRLRATLMAMSAPSSEERAANKRIAIWLVLAPSVTASNTRSPVVASGSQ